MKPQPTLPPRKAKVKAIQTMNEEVDSPQPLRERIFVGRGLLASPSTSRQQLPRGRGLMATYQRQNPIGRPGSSENAPSEAMPPTAKEACDSNSDNTVSSDSESCESSASVSSDEEETSNDEYDDDGPPVIGRRSCVLLALILHLCMLSIFIR